MAANTKINSRSKGGRFERAIAKWLNGWTGYEFGRVPGSGSLRWKKTDNITGDIVCTDPKHSRRFPFSVECKNYQDIRFEHILLGNKSCKIMSFWKQATSDGERANKVPILIMKYNSMPKGESFFVVGHIDLTTYLLRTIGPDVKCMTIYTGSDIISVFMASQVKKVPYSEFYKIGRQIIKEK